MITMKPLGTTQGDTKKAKALYYRAFPKNERRPFPELAENRLGNTEMVCFYDDDSFLGMACLLNSPHLSHIIYLAVEDSLRGQGYGARMLDLLHQSKGGKRVMVDIELPNPQAENAPQRIRRKSFYLRAGYEETSIRYRWRQEHYEILSYGGQISEQEYEQFWEDIKAPNA